MNFNFLPTDNLYKFLFIAGIFIYVFFYYFTTEGIYRIREDVLLSKKIAQPLVQRMKEDSVEFKKIISEAGRELTEFTNRFNARVNRQESVAARLKRAIIKEDTVKVLQLVEVSLSIIDSIEKDEVNRPRAEDVEAKFMALRRKEKVTDSLFEVHSTNMELLYLRQDKFFEYSHVLRIVTGISILMIVIGFGGWLRHQLAIDREMFRIKPKILPLSKAISTMKYLNKKSKVGGGKRAIKGNKDFLY